MKAAQISTTVAALALYLAQPAYAHSWADQLRKIASNGTLIGEPGYIRGYVSRADAGFNDDTDTYLLPPNGRSDGKVIHADDPLCHASQRTSNYSATYPKLSVAAGDYIALRYQENGHVSLPNVNPTKPLNRGTVYIYGTSEPVDDEKFSRVFGKWTADGTGGNGKGRLLATRNFDDGQCYQINSGSISTQRQAEFPKTAENPMGADLWCQNDIQLPDDLKTGSDFTLYWVWNWPTMNKAGSPTDTPGDGFEVTTLQYYTSCMDVTVTAASASDSSAKAVNSFASSFSKGQDLNNAAVLDQLTGGAFQVAVPGVSSSSGSSSSGSSSSAGDSTSATAITTGSATASVATAATAGKSGHKETIVVTVTTTQAPVYITVTMSPSSQAAATTQPTTSRSFRSTKDVTTLVTRTITPESAVATTTVVVATPGVAPAVRPFQNSKRSYVRRRRQA